jgi:polar amino acid transport system substrate-binding protein
MSVHCPKADIALRSFEVGPPPFDILATHVFCGHGLQIISRSCRQRFVRASIWLETIMKRRRTIFTALSFGLLLAFAQFAGAIAEAEQAPDPRVSDLVQAGRLRVALGLGPAVSAIKDPATGEVRGPALDLARALAARIGIELHPVEYQRPGAVLEGVRTNSWDVTFLVIDAVRAAEVDFSPPYMESDFTYLVPAGSSIRNVADADQPGVRIAVPRGDAVDLSLSRILKQAVLARADSQTAGMNLLRTGQTDAYAAPRATLLALAAQFLG